MWRAFLRMKELTISIGQSTNKGPKEQNQDSYGVLTPTGYALKHKGIAAVIADGMSSCADGKAASESCVKAFMMDYYSTPDSWTVGHSVSKVITATNQWLQSQGHRRFNTNEGLVSTLSALILKGQSGHLFHVGDSRIYLLRNGEFEQLTKDHRFTSEKGSYLTRAVGIDLKLDVDYRKIILQQGDVLLFTTDGIHDFISDNRLHYLLASNEPQKATELIVAEALKNNTDDNSSCQAIRVESLPAANASETNEQTRQLPFPPDLEAGNKLDGMEILKLIHASTRTQVYLAKNIETGEKMIIKTPSVNHEDNPAFIEHFTREEWALQRIHNKHIVKTVQPPQQRTFLYYAVEYISGNPLDTLIDPNKPLEIKAFQKLIKQACHALRTMHRAEMIHQDLKPDNIMVGDDGTLKIIDFGSVRIAGILESAQKTDEDLLGTVNYTAPEYYQNAPITNQCDIYALGVIAYQLLTGKLPYKERKSFREKPLYDYTPATESNPLVPTWLDGAIKKAVNPDTRIRYQDVDEFLYDCLHPNPNLVQQRFRPLAERNPVRFWQVTTALAVLSHVLWLYFKP